MRRLKTTTGRREVGAAALTAAGAQNVSALRLAFTAPSPPQTISSAVQFYLDLGPRPRCAASEKLQLAAAEERIRELPEEAVWT